MVEAAAKDGLLAAAAAAALGWLGTAVGVWPGPAAAVGAGAAAGLLWLRARQRRVAAAVGDAPPSAGAVGRLAGLTPDLLEALPLGLLLLDSSGRVLFCNGAGEEMIERRVTGMMASAALRAPALTEAIAAALGEGRRAEFDVTLLRGKERIIHASVTPLGDAAAPGGSARAVVLLEDRTRAAKAEALRRDFVANASHELRTPLASISGFIETLQGHARGDTEASDNFLRIMAAQAHRMRRLIDDLLSLNRIEIDEHVMPRDRVDLFAAVRETANALSPLAEAAGTRVVIELPDHPAPVRGSQDELAQVFANLIDNAVKYAAEGGPIRVVLEPPDAARPGMVGVGVVDSGPGIAREHLPRLTERFYRVSDARSRERGGTGLGLAIAKHIMNRHRGDLAVTSTLGKGTRFTVWLPMLPAEPASQAALPARQTA